MLVNVQAPCLALRALQYQIANFFSRYLFHYFPSYTTWTSWTKIFAILYTLSFPLLTLFLPFLPWCSTHHHQLKFQWSFKVQIFILWVNPQVDKCKKIKFPCVIVASPVQSYTLVKRIGRQIPKMTKAGLSHTRFHALFVLNNHRLCFLFLWLYILVSAKAACSPLLVSNWFLHSFTYRGYSVPQKKGFWSSPAGNPGRNIDKTVRDTETDRMMSTWFKL